MLQSLQQGGLSVSLLEALNAIDLSQYDITIYVYSKNNPWRNLFPNEVRIIIDPDRSHYHRRPKAVWYHFCIMLSKILKTEETRNRFETKLHKYVHEKKAKYPFKRYFKDGVDVAISYAIGLCTEMVTELNAKKRFVFFHSSKPDFHRDICEKCFYSFDNIIAVSSNVQSMLRDTYPEYRDRIAIIRNYLNPTRINMLSNEYSIDISGYQKDYIFTSVIRLGEEKGADLLVEAALLLKNKDISFVWFVVGDGDSRRAVEKMINRNNLLENVILVGFKDNPYPYIKCCDCYIHPAYEESFGLAILEALILNKPVISTDTMGADEVLAHGKYGMLVPINSHALARGIMQFIEKPRNNVSDISQYLDDEKKVYIHKWKTILDGKTL